MSCWFVRTIPSFAARDRRGCADGRAVDLDGTSFGAHRAPRRRTGALHGTFETCRLRRAMSEFESKAETICSY